MRIANYVNTSRFGHNASMVIFKPRLEEGAGLLLYTVTPVRVADCVLSGDKAAPRQTEASPRKSCYVGIYVKISDWIFGKGPWITVSVTLDKDR